jgi:thiamine-phosphate pyrophosphorylase
MAAIFNRDPAARNRALPLVLMTDARDADWADAARRLPRGSLVVVRGRTRGARAALLERLLAVPHVRLSVADDPVLAARVGALHLPEARIRDAGHFRARHPQWLLTAAVHSLAAIGRARHLDALFLSPVFATASHPAAAPLTPVRAGLIARASLPPVYALGGITARNAAALPPSFDGIAAIGALL